MVRYINASQGFSSSEEKEKKEKEEKSKRRREKEDFLTWDFIFP